MKTISILLTALLLLGASLNVNGQVTNETEETPYEKATKSSNFSMDHVIFFAPTIDEEPIGSDILTGYIVVYVYGNTECASCIGLGRAIADAKREKYNKTKDVKFVYFTTDNKSAIKRLINIPKIKYDYIVSLPFEKLVDIGFMMPYKPTYVIVDRYGKVVAKGIGCSHITEEAKKTFDEKIGAEIDKLLNVNAVDGTGTM